MADKDLVPLDPLGGDGDVCASCSSPLANDQRYCLNCGRRRAGERVAYAELLSGREANEVLAVGHEQEEPEPPRRRLGPGLLGGAAAFAGITLLALGVLIGVMIDDEPPPQVAAAPVRQPAPVVNVTTGGGGGEGETASTDAAFTSDWPEGESGSTVQLQTLPIADSDQAAVDSAKSEAEAAGAEDVGALSSDEYSSLEPGNYVVYSGVFTGKGAKAKAQAALKRLKKDFPKAKVIEVSSGDEEFKVAKDLPEEKVEKADRSALEDLENSTGEEQQKKSAQLPETLELPGKPPPTDNKAPGGGGGGAEVIE